MNSPVTHQENVLFIYDGDCPICNYAAHALRIKETCGPLMLLNARIDSHSVLAEINNRHLDLDSGMVIVHKGEFYHGKNALLFMAVYGGNVGWFNSINKIIFKYKFLTILAYPFMRFTRNTMLQIKKVPQIKNLEDRVSPIFKSIFAKDWDNLPLVMKRHYANRPFSNDIATVEGVMEVESSKLGRMLAPLFRITGTLVPYEGRNIPATVNFLSDPKSKTFRFDRIFLFPGKPPYRFLSMMHPLKDNQLVEIMRIGFGWHMDFSWNGEKIILKHKAYKYKLGGWFIPLPLEIFLGTGYAEETPIDDNSFSMMMEIRHPLWGKVFGYSGIFKITKDI